MEFILTLLALGSIYAASLYLMRRRYANRLFSEQNKSSSLAISEAQWKQKNQILSDELSDAQKNIELLTLELSQHVAAEQEAHSILDALSKQLSSEASQRQTTEEQLFKAQQMINTASAQLKTTVEERMRELQYLQEQLHSESAARKQLEEIVSLKESEQQETKLQLRRTEEQLLRAKESLSATSDELHAAIQQHETTIQQLQSELKTARDRESELHQRVSELTAAKLSLEQETDSLTSQLRSEYTARTHSEHDRTELEFALKETIRDLESQLASATELLKQTSDALQEESGIRIATEHALQESKEKLYSLIHSLESTVAERDAVITALKEKLHHAETTVGKLHRAVQSIVSQVPIPVFMMNEEGYCTFVNDAFHTLLGYSSDDVVNRHFSKFFPEQERLFYEEQWKNALNRTEQFKGETPIVTSTGDALIAELNLIETEHESEKVFVGCIMDKSHEQETIKHYNDAKQRAEELKQLKSRFITMVTNQLRTSLVTVATNTELLERFLFKWSDEKRYRAFFRINESLKQMMDLLRNVESSTATGTGYTLSIKEINLESLAHSVVKEVTSDLDAKQRFILSEQGNISSVRLDERAVRTALYHILSNAFKFSSETDEVKLHIERNNSDCMITVQDSGIGIPASEQQYLFTSFFRASNVGTIYGTGLGLTIAQQYVQLAGGTISIDSELNKGTKVTITLPLAKQ
jgi:PAS domain S-box-containing protein